MSKCYFLLEDQNPRKKLSGVPFKQLCRIIRLLIVGGPNKLILKIPNSSLPPQPSAEECQALNSKSQLPDPFFSAVLAQCQTTKRTQKIHFCCHAVPQQSSQPFLQHILHCTMKADQVSQHEVVSPTLLFLRLQKWRNLGIFIQLCLYTGVAREAGG